METVTVSSKGQIAIPKQVRERLNLKQGTRLALTVRGREIVLAPAEDWRSLEGSMRGVDLLGDKAEDRRRELERDDRR